LKKNEIEKDAEYNLTSFFLFLDVHLQKPNSK